MTRRSDLFRNTTISTLSTVVQGVANLLTVVYLARSLYPQAYGVFSYTWAMVGMVGVLTYLGLPPLLTRRLSRDHDPTVTISYGVSFVGVLSLNVTLGFLVAVQLVPGLYRYHDSFDLWGLIILINGINPQWIFSGLQQLWVASLGGLVGTILRLGLTLWLVHGPGDLNRAVGVTVFATAIPVLGEMIWVRRHVRFSLDWIPPKEIWTTIRSALPLGVTSFVSILYSGVDTWILHVFVGSRAVGVYSAAYRPITFLVTFSAVYFNLTYPILSRLTVQDRPLAQRVVQLASLSIFAIVMPMGVGTDVVAGPLMRQAFGSSYAASGLVLSVLIWSWIFGILRDTFSTTLIAGNGEVLFAKIFAVTGFVNAGLMWYCVRWGPVGTAAALAMTQGLLLVACLFAVRRVVPHPMQWTVQGRYALKIMLNSGIMGVTVWLVRPYVPVEVTILVGIVVYAGLTWITKAIPWREVLATLHLAP